MNNSTIYDHKSNYQMNDNMLSNLINNQRRTSNRFTKLCILNNKFDYENRLILREYCIIPLEENKKKTFVSLHLLNMLFWK